MNDLSGGVDEISRLGHATLTTAFDSVEQNIKFTAVSHGTPGNGVSVAYVDPGAASSALAVNVVGSDITISLETDADGKIVSTAQDIVNAIRNHAGIPAATDLVNASLLDYTQGGGEVVNPMALTYLTGGDDALTGDQGVQIYFTDDGSPLQVGDNFSIEVSYYMGDDQDIYVNANRSTRVKTNITGEEAMGGPDDPDNIMNTLARLKFALEQHDSDKVSQELPYLDAALERLTSQMGQYRRALDPESVHV